MIIQFDNSAVPITSSFDMANYTGMETNNIIQRQNNGQPIFDGAALYNAGFVSDDSVNYIINDFGDGTGEIVPLDANDDNPDFNNKIPITSSFDMANYTGMETNNYIYSAS